MPAIRKVTETDRPKRVDLFHYASVSQDLRSGDAMLIDTSVSTYGLGKSVIIAPVTDDQPYCVGAAQYARDASVAGAGWIPIVTRGVFDCQADGAGGGSVTAGLAVTCGGDAEAGEFRLVATGTAAEIPTAVGTSLEATGADGKAEIWLWGKFVCDSPA